MIKSKIIISVTALSMTLSACGPTAQFQKATQSMQSVTAARAPLSESDLALSCEKIDQDLTKLYARYEELEAAERSRQQKAGLLNGALSVGVGILGGTALASAGSVEAINNVGVATSVAGSAVDALTDTGLDQQSLNKTTAVAERTAILERVKIEKGC